MGQDENFEPPLSRRRRRRQQRPQSAGSARAEGYWHSMDRAPVAPLVEASQRGWKQVLQAKPAAAHQSDDRAIWKRLEDLWTELRVQEGHRRAFRASFRTNRTAQARHVSQLLRHRRATIRVLDAVHKREKALQGARALLDTIQQPGYDEDAMAVDLARALALVQHWTIQFAEALEHWWADFTHLRPFMVNLAGSLRSNYAMRVGVDLDDARPVLALPWARAVLGGSNALPELVFRDRKSVV